jgi:2,4-dienoyl-CoA reductase-like NADH-dependent reductase (Old Yellow Enzyme family)
VPAAATEIAESFETETPSFSHSKPAAEPTEASTTESPAQKASDPLESMAATGSGFTITETASDESTQPKLLVRISWYVPAAETVMAESFETETPSFSQLYPAAELVEASPTESPAQKVSDPFESMAATGSGFTITETTSDESTQPKLLIRISWYIPAAETATEESEAMETPFFIQLYPAAELAEASTTESPAQKVSDPFESIAATGSGFTIIETASDESTQPKLLVTMSW